MADTMRETSAPNGSESRKTRAVVPFQTFLLYAGSALIALVVGAVLIIVTSSDLRARYSYFFAVPGDAIGATAHRISEVYGTLLTGAVGSPSAYLAFIRAPGADTAGVAFSPISETLVAAAPLIVAGLGISLAFRAGLINVGGPGQAALGALTAAVVGYWLDLPFPLPLLMAAGAAVLVGGLWGALVGWLKARFGAHEVVTTIMLNYAATNLVVLALSFSFLRRPGRSDPITPEISEGARLPGLFGSDFRVNIGILVAIAAAVLFWVLLNRTPQGLELRAVGQSRQAATALGINHRRVWVGAMAGSGGLVALGAAIHVMGVEHAMTPGTAGTLGIDALVVALLGRTGPVGCCVAGVIVGGMRAGGTQVQALTGVPYDIVTCIQAVLVLLIATPRVAKALFRLRKLSIKPSTTHGWAA
ncbi:ABC transporter permease [Amycolatopsis pithecellobii]|uniref:ABC transporter permease n=1 Tax=Amycolatopsis pithecellobii TaxID=664692 RepID=A0A6N7YLW0_9PSEU|nr:ABC transporter permease [Amycolatopsis pithecellobii]MTD53022.1 ABC transporter permease [Amycolatopsis pithecellobii]